MPRRSSATALLGLVALLLSQTDQAAQRAARNPGGAKKSAEGQPIDSNDILVAVHNSVREYTLAGTLIQTLAFDYGGRPYPGASGVEYLRGIVVDQYGSIDSVNGTFYPLMSRYSPDTGTFSNMTFSDWSSASAGTIAAAQNYVFAADSSFSGGIVRFDTFNNIAAHFATGLNFIA